MNFQLKYLSVLFLIWIEAKQNIYLRELKKDRDSIYDSFLLLMIRKLLVSFLFLRSLSFLLLFNLLLLFFSSPPFLCLSLFSSNRFIGRSINKIHQSPLFLFRRLAVLFWLIERDWAVRIIRLNLDLWILKGKRRA